MNDSLLKQASRRFIALVFAALAFSPLSIHARSFPYVERIFINGKIWTEDDAHPLAQAIAVTGDKIVAVGTSAEIRAMAQPDTQVVDLRGHLVVPGFQDSHMHFPGPSVNSVKLDGIEALSGFQKALGDFAKSHPDLTWITG